MLSCFAVSVFLPKDRRVENLRVPVRGFRLVFFVLLVLPSAMPLQTLADDDVETVKEPKRIQASQCIDLFRFTVNLSRGHSLATAMKEKFPRYEGEILEEVASMIDPSKFSPSGHTSFGQRYGVYFPEEESFAGLVMPLNAGELLGDEDYSLGEDENGSATMGGYRAVKSEHYFGMTISEDEDDTLIFPEQETLSFVKFVEQNESKLATIDVAPATVGRSPLKKHLMAYQIALATEAQQRDDEENFEYSWRAMYAKHHAHLVQMFFRDVEHVGLTFQSPEAGRPFSFEFRLECRRKSDLLGFFQEMHGQRNRSLSWLHPTATSFATWRAILPKELQQQLAMAGQQTAKALRAAGESASVAAQVQNSTAQLANYGAVELLLQLVPFSETSESLVLVVPLGRSAEVNEEFIHLISGNDGLQATTELDGRPVYPLDDLLGLGQSTWMTVSDAALIFATGDEDDQQKAMDLMSEIMRKEFSPAAGASRLPSAFAAVRTSLRDLLRLADGVPEYAARFVPDGTELPTDGRAPEIDQDAIQLTCALDGNEVFVNFTFEPNALAMGVTVAESLLVGCGMLLNFL